MSRWNGAWYDLTRPLRELFLVVIVAPIFLAIFSAVAIVYDTEEAMDRCDRLVCRLTEHQWADDDKYGVEPVCLECGARREVDDVD